MIDPALNSRLRNGDSGAYETLYALTAARLRNYCRIFLTDNLLIEDLVQNAYLKLWEKRKEIRENNSVESLLFTMVRNQCLNYLRDHKLEKESFSIDENQWSELQHLYQIDFTGLEEKTLEEQLFVALKTAIDNLPDRQKEILLECKIKGKKQKQVAEELGVSVKAIEKNLTKAKKHLHDDLIKQFPQLAVLIAMLLN